MTDAMSRVKAWLKASFPQSMTRWKDVFSLVQELEATRKQLERAEKTIIEMMFQLEYNADGKQPYGGFHTVQDEFQAIHGIARDYFAAKGKAEG